MKLTRLVIRQLFNQFDYDISFENKENILILTGANGTGKTMILNMIERCIGRLAHFDFDIYFKDIPVKGIDFYFDGELSVVVDESTTRAKFFQNGKETSLKFLSLQNLRTHLITSDRLKQLQQKDIEALIDNELVYDKTTELVPYIFLCNDVLCDKMLQINHSLADLSYKLDSSFPQRLLNEKRKITKEEFEIRFKKIQEKQEHLKKYGLSEGKQEDTEFSIEDAKTLLVYLNDVEEKLSIYDDLLARLDLFVGILNSRRFFDKKIAVNKNGFYFITNQGKNIGANKLSSGEQHQVILLYELLFSTEENMLVLIDEPEISLHVSWQKSFVDDLLEIMKLRKMQVIIATHSPDIVNGHWNLVHTLNPSPSQEA